MKALIGNNKLTIKMQPRKSRQVNFSSVKLFFAPVKNNTPYHVTMSMFFCVYSII